MKLCRFRLRKPRAGASDAHGRWGVVEEGGRIRDLSDAGWRSLDALWEAGEARECLTDVLRRPLTDHSPDDIEWLAPVDAQEVWAAGVTYLRSKTARMEESEFSATAYDRVYEAERPELFFKAMPAKVVGPGQPVAVRRDSKWTVPEPELALVLNPRGEVVGYTVGNDMSARDIEGDNLLYLPQAKIYTGSCALGPWVVLGPEEAAARAWTIGVRIRRGGDEVFAGQTEVGRLKRRFADLAAWLFRAQAFPHGAVLLTGTGVVPPDDFSLQAGDEVEIEVSGIGRLINPVVVV